MRFKIPCKKFSLSEFLGLALASLLLVSATEVIASQDQAADRSLFWSIQKDGQAAGYLLGTIHSEDPRVLDFPEDFIARLRANSVFAMELVPDLPTLARLLEYMNYPPGQTLESVIGSARFKSLESTLSTYNVSPEQINRMKPWAAMMTLSTPPPETGFFMDLSLSLRATGSGLKVVGLETLDQQLSFLENMPLPMQLSLLEQAIAAFDQVKDAHDQMVNVYLENDLVALQEISDKQLQQVDDQAGNYFVELGINARNLRMAETLLPQLEVNKVFVAVGALHLPGEKGLLNILRQQGYELSPLDMPFTQDSVVQDQ
jgi:uncharacterized protein YbaP (TraB family)